MDIQVEDCVGVQALRVLILGRWDGCGRMVPPEVAIFTGTLPGDGRLLDKKQQINEVYGN